MLSRQITIDTSDFHSILNYTTRNRINPPKDVLIQDHVWVGFNASINKGAIINKNSIVASKSVVLGKDYPPKVILAGIPAKIVKNNITWSREKLPY
jgi:acetyltransferase-like isoleucine patch superfamily enzyme